MSEISQILQATIRTVHDFPKKGISFKDITPIFLKPEINQLVVDQLSSAIESLDIDVVVGIDSRGFIIGNSLALALKKPFALARKKGKLPYEVVSETYALEYGEDTLQLHVDAINQGDRVLIHDDLLATGGTAACVARLVERLGGEVVAASFIVELKFLEGRKLLEKYTGNIIGLTSYE